MDILVAICLMCAGGVVGWCYAHYVIAKECRKLGAFYVGNDVFKCVAIEPKSKTPAE